VDPYKKLQPLHFNRPRLDQQLGTINAVSVLDRSRGSILDKYVQNL
jgi:hypothetical protein